MSSSSCKRVFLRISKYLCPMIFQTSTYRFRLSHNYSAIHSTWCPFPFPGIVFLHWEWGFALSLGNSSLTQGYENFLAEAGLLQFQVLICRCCLCVFYLDFLLVSDPLFLSVLLYLSISEFCLI